MLCLFGFGKDALQGKPFNFKHTRHASDHIADISKMVTHKSRGFSFSPLGLIRRAHLLITHVMPIQPHAAAVRVAVLILSQFAIGEPMNTYQVINSGRLWRVVDRSKGGKVLCFRQSYLEAFEPAKSMEAKLRIAIAAMIEQRKAEMAESLRAA